MIDRKDTNKPKPGSENTLMEGLRVQLGERLVGESRRIERQRQVRRKLAAGISAVTALAICAMLAISSITGDSNVAYGSLQLFEGPTVDATKELNGGLTVSSVLGPKAHLDRAYVIPFFGYRAYVVQGGQGWCLIAPDPQSPNPDRERGVTCTPTRNLQEFGISLRVGDHYLAAIPKGVKNPTLRRKGSAEAVALPLDNRGVVKAKDLKNGDVITLFNRHGDSRRDRVTER